MFRIYVSSVGCIYDDTEVSSTTRVVEPVLTLEANKSGSLTFKIKSQNKPSSQLEILKDEIWVTRKRFDDPEEIIWAGRIIDENRDSYNDREFTCEGALGYFNDTYQPANSRFRTDARTLFSNIVGYHNYIAMQYYLNHAILISDITENASYSALYTNPGTSAERSRSLTMSSLEENILDMCGGQMMIRHGVMDAVDFIHYLCSTNPDIDASMESQLISNYLSQHSNAPMIVNYLDYINAYDTENRQPIAQTIEFGKNLISITKRVSAEDFATIVIPYGRSLTEPEKAWPYYRSISKTKAILITASPDDAEEKNLSVGYYIDAENGKKKQIANNNYAVFPDISVTKGDSFFLSTHMEGPYTDVSATVYVVLDNSGNKLSSGASVRKSKDGENEDDGKVTISDVRVDIPENGTILRIGVYFDSDSRVCLLRKLNPFYAETNRSIIDYDISLADQNDPVDPLIKPATYAFQSDVYPVPTSDLIKNVSKFEQARMVVHKDLCRDFGPIVKVVSDDNCTSPIDIYPLAKNELKEMSEKVEIEIEAADLSYIDPEVPPFRLLDLVHVISEPHLSEDLLLPIMKIELPLESPEQARYTLSNDVKLRDGSPTYMSQYVAENYKKG